MQQTARHIRLRPIAIPVEHGGWALVGSPILLGLLLSFSTAGALIGVGAISLFLFRHPFRLAVNDIRRRKLCPRTQWAVTIAAAYLSIAAISLGFAWIASPNVLAPILLLLSLGGAQFILELSGHGRTILAESSGAVALSCIACAIVLAGRGDTAAGWMATLILSLHSVTAITYVGARLKLSRGVAVNRFVPTAMQLLTFVVVLALAINHRCRMLLPAVFAGLTLRTMWGLSDMRMNVRPAIVGIQEIGFSLSVVFASTLSLRP